MTVNIAARTPWPATSATRMAARRSPSAMKSKKSPPQPFTRAVVGEEVQPWNAGQPRRQQVLLHSLGVAQVFFERLFLAHQFFVGFVEAGEVGLKFFVLYLEVGRQLVALANQTRALTGAFDGEREGGDVTHRLFDEIEDAFLDRGDGVFARAQGRLGQWKQGVGRWNAIA